MPWAPNNLATKGALASFHQGMETGESVYDKHCQITQSTSASETYAFPGFLPAPRMFLGNRQFVDAKDFTFTLTNNEYELSMVTNRKSWEDDQTGLINARYAEMGEVWKSQRDNVFAQILTLGNSAGNVGFDGTTFHGDTHVGTLGTTVDNNIAGVAAATSAITASEMLTMVNTVRTAFLSFTDDTGRAGYNRNAVGNMRFVMTPGHARGGYEAMNQVAFTGGSGASNEYGRQFIGGVDIMPELLATPLGTPLATQVYASALGSVRKPFIYQERTPLEIIIKAGADDVAENNGVMLLTRQRYIMTYGDFRRSIMVTLA